MPSSTICRCACRRALVLCCFAVALTAACAQTVQPPGSTSPAVVPPAQVLVFSDLHFNPFSDPAIVSALQAADVTEWRKILAGSAQTGFSAYGSDSNYPLFASAVAAMRQAVPQPPLILIAGDFISHGFEATFKKTAPDTSDAALTAFTAKTNKFIADEIAATFPQAQILPALGNNDSSCGDYMSDPSSRFLRAFAEAWAPAVNRHGASDFLKTFPVDGNYTAFAPALNARVVVLNDVYWSPHYSDACGSPKDDPGRKTLAWLERVLTDSRARGEQVWLLSHVPVGIDAYASARGTSVVTMLQPAYAADLIASLQKFATTLRYSLYGHTHMMEFRVVPDANAAPLVAAQGIPAVSPIFGNNPAFVVLSLDSASRTMGDYTVHSLTNLPAAGGTVPGVWAKEYTFREAYRRDSVTAKTLGELRGLLETDGSARASFTRFYDSSSGRATPGGTEWRAVWCAIGNFDADAFTRCAKAGTN